MQFPSFPFLGTFSMLPTEIRLMIWGHLFSSLRIQPLKDSLRKDNPLSILCTNRYLYNEISSHLFDNSVQHILLDPEYKEEEWMVIQLRFRTLDIVWTLRNKAAVERHFHNFPHSKTTIKVHINSPNPTDPGQVVWLWQKSNVLVDLLIPLSQPIIDLTTNGPWRSQHPPTHWRNVKRFYEMGGLRESIESSKYRPDYDIAMLPFIRLELWIKDPATTIPAMSDKEFDVLYRRMVSLFDQAGIEIRLGKLLSITQDTAVSQIETAIVDTNLFLETSLDELPGATASFLRRERFKDWFEDGKSWKSLYETQLRDQLSTYPWVIINSDPWLYRSNQRYIVLILLHHAMYALKSNLYDGLGIHDESIIYMRWNSELWLELFPQGIPQLSDIQTWLARFWSEKYQFRKFHVYVDWLGQQRAEEIGLEECKCSLIHRLTLWGH
ncbi:hypothetical protein PEX1_092130 [Penicillium expansum]|uniref:F-box domain-containing protein n=1 Tax=Penicillium expansum TaxID=27334 RepID=A0A0A2L944_PENEN|nr:hypothetical protein PEX2_093150 [Penicillium expansum]KGO46962.1 hypothetical protein PEXP_063600 [Penicillium expansum]KGO58960.1 hypothetical protein PEX2_093150 [Penicillium expansum]KGO73135.1 hypothetical protein PEX1_092130 [Penicillium expansum]